MDKKHSLKTRLRALVIWQKLGYFPWRKPKEGKKRKHSGDFYKGAFDGIPFLNEDAKRTFSHLLLRPGYLIQDYVRGDHERYLAPLTALIIFYAFFGLVSAVVQPIHQQSKGVALIETLGEVNKALENAELSSGKSVRAVPILKNTATILRKGLLYLNLDQYPDEVDTHRESSLAALEGTLRSQGIPLFLGKFFLLWLAMSIALRKYKQRMSAYAAATAYILCQFSFFMLFALLFSFGKSADIGIFLMLLLLILDYHEWLGTPFRKSFWLAVKTGFWYAVLFGVVIILIGGTAFLIAYSRN